MSYLTYQFTVDRNTEYVAVNSHYRRLLELKDSYIIEGKRNHELPHVISEQAEQLDAHGQLVMQQEKMISGLTIDTFNGRMKFLYNRIIPVYDNEIVVGCEVTLNEVAIYSTRDIILNNMPRHMVFQRPSLLFTEKEYQILFLFFSRFSRKEISKILHISVSAINSRLECCYNKTGTLNLEQLLEYYHNAGLYTYLPEMFRNKGHIVFY